MNRPSFSNHISSQYQIIDYEGYAKELERYCYELEKTLDNACDMLATYDLANRYRMERTPYSVEEWKEWLMKDERTD